jgi:hypothetical protein
MKGKFKKIWLLLVSVFFIILLSNIIFSNPSGPFDTSRICSDMWAPQFCNSTTLDDANFEGCNGTEIGGPNGGIEEVIINQSNFFPNSGIDVTCKYNELEGYVNYVYIWYYNGSNWTNIQNFTNTSVAVNNYFNVSTVFNLNSSEGEHRVRCIYSLNMSGKGMIPNQCANSTYSYIYDNDDVNFTVTSHLTYDFWNLTNYTTGANISSGQNFTRIDIINVYAQWNKIINNFWVNHDGNGSSVNYSMSSSSNWTNYTLNFSNGTEFSRTGNITVSTIYANDTTSATNNTSPSLFFYLWGFSKIDQITLNQTTLYNNTPVRTFCKAIDNITNQGLNSSNVSFYGNDNFLNWSLTNSSGYANLSFVVNATSLPSNYTVKCNITNEPSLNYNASSDNLNSTNISVLNPYEIQVGNVWFNYSGITTNKTNLFTDLTIYANVTDDWRVSTVLANLSYPSTIIINLSMIGDNSSADWHVWNYTFNSQYPLNASGNYTVRVIANNSNGISNSSNFLTFYVNNTYDVNLSTNYSIYNRGENITVQIWDVNNFSVYDLNWTVNLTKFNQTPNITNPNNTNYTYTIANDDPEGNYTLFVNVSKNNNTANNSWNFSVSKNLTIAISTSPSSSPSKNSNVIASASLYNARGELYNSSTNANITCANTMYPLNFSSGQASYTCVSPNDYSTPFNITINVTDDYNNSGENYTTLTTAAQEVAYVPSGGGGGPATVETKKCSDNTSYNQCSSKRPFYCLNGNLTQNCSICGCSPGYSCQPSGSCILTKEEDFNFTIEAAEVEIEQGKDTTIMGHLSNTGNTILSLMSFLNVSENCCNVSIPSSFTLNEKEEKEFEIKVHVPLTTNVSDYNIKIGIGTAYFKKEKTIKVIVLKSPYYDYLSQIEAALANLEKEIQEYKKSGINVGNAEALVEQAKLTLRNANSSISSDQVNVLANSISDLKNNINYVSTSLTLLRGQRFLSQNSWLIILLIISSILTIYFVPEVFIPLNKVEKEIKRLRNEEKNLVSSRVETEKQYFLRKIDENTFSKIMITKQDNILKLRGTIHERENDRTKILTRTHPKEIAKWFASGIKNLPKNIKNLFVRLIKAPKINLFKGKPKMVI